MHGVLAKQHRRRAAGNQRRRDDDVGGARTFVDQRGLALAIRVVHFPRVAAGRFRRGVGLGRRHLDEPRAERLDLFLDGRPYVEGLDHRAQPLRGGDCLQTGDARAQHQHARRLDRARSRHQHRHETPVFVRREHHGLVAGDVRLRRQHIHRLGARGAGNQFHREGGNAGGGECVDGGLLVRVEETHQKRPAAQHRPLRALGQANLQDEVGFRVNLRRAGGDDRPGRLEVGVRDSRSYARVRLHGDGVVAGDELANRLGSGSDPAFTGPRFGGNADTHTKVDIVPESFRSPVL